ncbi:MAG: VOC family protein [Cyanobacteria bacterium]|nr:VOC family protein [Cyanobacteriota bacterium]
MRIAIRSCLIAVTLITFSGGRPAAQTPTYPYDHIHLNVPDPAVASVWYEKNIPGGRRITEAPDRIMYGSTRLMFLRSATAKPSAGSAIDHIGFSVADLDAKMKEWEAAGITVTTPVRDVPKLFKLAFLEDPWGTRIEVVQDPELLGLHHVHLRNPNPDEGYAWLLDKFGGKRDRLKGTIDGIRYDYDGFTSVWVLITKGEAEPSQGRAIDHIGWRSVGDLQATIDSLRAKKVEVTSEPRPLTLPNGPPINFSYVAGPAGARIELVERPGLKPGQ